MADPQPAPIEIVETIVPKQIEFVPFSDADNTQSLADNLPDGELYRAKNMPESTFRELLYALALEIGRVEGLIEFIADDYYIWTTEALLESWERAVGIPDSCFKTTGLSLDERRRNVIAKFALMNIITRDDFVLLAEFFGFRIEITNGYKEVNGNAFPLTFPFVFSDSSKEARFTMIVKFLDKVDPNVFPFTFPITFGDDETSFLRCVFRKLKPAYCRIIFLYLGE